MSTGERGERNEIGFRNVDEEAEHGEAGSQGAGPGSNLTSSAAARREGIRTPRTRRPRRPPTMSRRWETPTSTPTRGPDRERVRFGVAGRRWSGRR
jgi:hypothetical protein